MHNIRAIFTDTPVAGRCWQSVHRQSSLHRKSQSQSCSQSIPKSFAAWLLQVKVLISLSGTLTSPRSLYLPHTVHRYQLDTVVFSSSAVMREIIHSPSPCFSLGWQNFALRKCINSSASFISACSWPLVLCISMLVNHSWSISASLLSFFWWVVCLCPGMANFRPLKVH
jgi:hypothetical protein